MFLWTRRMLFHNPVEDLPFNIRKLFSHEFIFSISFFVANCSSGRAECGFDTFAENCWLKV